MPLLHPLVVAASSISATAPSGRRRCFHRSSPSAVRCCSSPQSRRCYVRWYNRYNMHSDRGWMYARLKDGLLNSLFLEGLNEFISAAKQFPGCLNGELIRCPCNQFKCQNHNFEYENTVRFHLMKYGFVRDYYQLVADAAGPSFSPSISNEPPNQSTQRLYDMLAAANQELWPGCENHSQLSVVARILNIKSEHHLSERCFDNIFQFIKEILPIDNLFTDNFYSTKKLLEGLGLPIQKIHSCLNSCMIYWGEDNELLRCKVCDHPRYKRLRDGQSSSKTQVAYSKMYYMPITPRLQRLYASNATAKDITCAEKRNVRLGLCTDGFQPFGQSRPRNPKDKLDVYLQPLVTELEDLWENGVETYDAFNKENFNLRAALMWTISDFPAYAMLSGWSTAGRTACPYYMENSDAFDKRRKLNHQFSGEEVLKQIDELGFKRVIDEDAAEINSRLSKQCGWRKKKYLLGFTRIMPIAFRELLPSNVWQPLTKLSNYFRELTSTAISESDMLRLHGEIPLIICKLERVFPPSFFDCMEHLPIHLAYEAWLVGPVQYRWMYPFERYLRRLKNNVKNKARVEGSICNAYLVEEATSFCAHYFKSYVQTRHRKVPSNVDISESNENYEGNLSIFMQFGRPIGKGTTRYLMEDEYKAAQIIYIDQLHSKNPLINDSQIDIKLESEFAIWFNNFAHNLCSNISNKFIILLAKGPLRSVTSYNGYIVNGYKFQSKSYYASRASMNSEVCIKGSNYSSEESDYYGQLLEVIRLEYPSLSIKRVVLFKCNWFDPTPNVGTKVHSKYKLIDVNHKRSFNRYEPFVLGVQAIQVIYTPYPSLKRDKIEWWATVKVKARSVIQLSTQENTTY
ncbi:uncharacterized protein LOC122723981 [Manihot esculenta]|uniref:uncharacterized protein LOC122723981 n=1 Tax=Manihot esculenta TaxID=3983 RepID=UPI001CC38290|nr:uncharacterized protein LOC122723981 [Manihot esculenta]